MNLPIYMLVERGLGMNLIRTVFAYLDMVAFKLFSWLMTAVFDIANLTLVKESVFESLQQRVYVILGIFMLFKLTMSLLSYLVNPDKINDKEQGISKIVTRTVVSLCMLVAIPFVFDLLYEAQGPILEAVPRIILGKASTVDGITTQSESLGNKMAWSTYGLVFPIEEAEGFNTVDAVPDHVNDPSYDNSVYKYNYIPILGAIVAIIMSFVLLGICIDVAIRAFKLAILRMIAPIPIISYIDPKSAKDGMFQNYIKTLTSTYLDLFIQIGVLYFVLMMIDEVLFGGLDLGGLTGIRAAVAVVFIIIGLLFFARQFPNFIRSALGIKNSKGLGLGLGGALAAGGALLGGAGLAGMMKAGGDYMNEAADATASGKAPGPSWGRGRDIAAQLRTGDSNAKAKNLGQTINDQLMRANAAMHGVTEDSLDTAKKSMYNAKDRAADANAMRERFMQNGKLSEEDKHRLSSWGVSNEDINNWNQSAMDALVNKENTNAAKAEKYYSKAEKYAAARGVRTEKPLNSDLGTKGFGRFDPALHNRESKSSQYSTPPSGSSSRTASNSSSSTSTDYSDALSYNDEYMAGSGDNVFTNNNSSTDTYEDIYNQYYDSNDN